MATAENFPIYQFSMKLQSAGAFWSRVGGESFSGTNGCFFKQKQKIIFKSMNIESLVLKI